jgi:hypothetical protein
MQSTAIFIFIALCSHCIPIHAMRTKKRVLFGEMVEAGEAFGSIPGDIAEFLGNRAVQRVNPTNSETVEKVLNVPAKLAGKGLRAVGKPVGAVFGSAVGVVRVGRKEYKHRAWEREKKAKAKQLASEQVLDEATVYAGPSGDASAYEEDYEGEDYEGEDYEEEDEALNDTSAYEESLLTGRPTSDTCEDPSTCKEPLIPDVSAANTCENQRLCEEPEASSSFIPEDLLERQDALNFALDQIGLDDNEKLLRQNAFARNRGKDALVPGLERRNAFQVRRHAN